MRTGQARPARDRAMASRREPPEWRRRPRLRPLRYPVAAAAVVVLVAGGAMTLLTVSHGPGDRPLADDCGLVTCAASLPREVTGTAAPGAARSTARPQPTAPQPTVQPVLAPQAHPIRTKRPASPAPSPLPSHPGHHHHGQGQQ